MPRILLLETDQVLARNTIAIFESAEFEVEWHVDPQEAIAALDIKPADVIVMDLIFTGRSGIEFLYELRSYPDWSDLPVILHSSVPPREIFACVASLEQLQIKAYHYKPTTLLAELAASVEACLHPAIV
jgi:CheY-like chemotaxis protein